MAYSMLQAIVTAVRLSRGWIDSFSPFSRALTSSACSNADEVVKDVYFGYWTGTKTDSNKQTALGAIRTIKGWLSQSPNKESFKYLNGNIVGYMWVGSMVQNTGFSDNAMKVLEDEINNNDGDPMKSFGVTLNTGGSDKLGDVQRAVKLWSQGKAYNTKTGNKIYSEAGNCYYIKLESGTTASDQSGIDVESLHGNNSDLDFTKLQPGQPICTSIGNLPNFKPNKYSDGSCYNCTVKSGDTCSEIIASYYPLSLTDLNIYNKQTFGWYGCNTLMAEPNICLSDGTSPKPTLNPIAECGPLAPGNLFNTTCPLNACCSELGFCALTSEFCNKKSRDTGAPGTTGCISNCGYGVVSTTPATTFKDIVYWMDSDDPDLASDPYLLEDYTMFIMPSFGGFDFSTSPSTYKIFRNAVADANREKFANNLINFMNKYNLDGIDLDWEYPGAPDIPGIPAGDKDNGKRYLELVFN